jgi:hypothetical protein
MRLRALLIATVIVLVLLIVLSFVRLDGESEAPAGAAIDSYALDSLAYTLRFFDSLRLT